MREDHIQRSYTRCRARYASPPSNAAVKSNTDWREAQIAHHADFLHRRRVSMFKQPTHKHIVNIVEIHNENGLCLMCVESLLPSLSNNSSDHHDWLLHILLYFSHHVTRRGEYLDLLWTLCTFSLGYSSVSDMQTTQYALFLNTVEFLKENRSKSNNGIIILI